MIAELVEKIIVHRAYGRKPNRTQQIEFYFNFIGTYEFTDEDLAIIQKVKDEKALQKDREGITEDMKRSDHMEWARRMASINEIANEIIRNEMIFI